MNKIIEMKFGSHLYGTDTPESDLDLKAIYLPTAREIVLGTYKETINISRNKASCERNTKDDTDTEIFSLDRFLDLLMQGQTVALDMLFSPDSLCTFNEENINIWRAIKLHKDKLLTRNVNAFICYAKQQAAKYGIKGSRMDSLKRTKELLDLFSYHDRLSDYALEVENLVSKTKELISLEKTPLIEVVMLKGPKGLIDQPHLRVNGRSIPFHATVKYAREVVNKMLDSYGERANKAHLAGGKDFKALSHSCRVNSEALELLTTGYITFPRPDREMLTNIKLGNVEYDKVAEMIEQGLADCVEAHKTSTLRDEPDREWAADLVYEVYSGIVKKG